MNHETIKQRIDRLNVWKQGGQRAPHKPLLLLYALGRCLRGEDRLMPYAEVDRVLRKLLAEFGPSRKSYHPEYPFWRLQNDGLWELTDADKLQLRQSSTDTRKSELLKYDVQGGFRQEVQNQLCSDRSLATEIVRQLLNASFPASIHEDILQAVGIELGETPARVKVRDPYFRDRVLRAYEYRCAVCGFNVRVGDSLVALEAAHIKWFQAGGPDRENNGIALCTMHHKLFDRGAFTITNEMEMQVSEIAHGTSGFNEWLLAFHGQPIRAPQRPLYYPDSSFVNWHVREVFKGYSRHQDTHS